MNSRKTYFVYITASISRVLYIGMTGDLPDRISQHKSGKYGSVFTRKYNVNRLVYFEEHARVYDAIAREKQIKRWSRRKKVRLIEEVNPKWRDLSREWIDHRW